MKKVLLYSACVMLSACQIFGASIPDFLTKETEEELSSKGIQAQYFYKKTVFSVPSSVIFGQTKATIQGSAEKTLKTFNEVLKNANRPVQILCYVNQEKTSARAIANRRGNAISNFLRVHGLDVDKISYKGIISEDTKDMIEFVIQQ